MIKFKSLVFIMVQTIKTTINVIQSQIVELPATDRISRYKRDHYTSLVIQEPTCFLAAYEYIVTVDYIYINGMMRSIYGRSEATNETKRALV